MKIFLIQPILQLKIKLIMTTQILILILIFIITLTCLSFIGMYSLTVFWRLDIHISFLDDDKLYKLLNYNKDMYTLLNLQQQFITNMNRTLATINNISDEKFLNFACRINCASNGNSCDILSFTRTKCHACLEICGIIHQERTDKNNKILMKNAKIYCMPDCEPCQGLLVNCQSCNIRHRQCIERFMNF